MYKAIIIDDEDIVRNGIKDLINWSSSGFEICAEGIDGRDGLEKILKYQPQLVLVDIKMPELSGIDVIREARKNQYNGQFIILTGFSEFEYAQSAITLGVKGYLLKPIDEFELEKKVKEIYKDLEKQEKINKIAKEELLRKCLLNIESEKNIDKDIGMYELLEDNTPHCVAIVSRTQLKQKDEKMWNNESIEMLLSGFALFVDKLFMNEVLILIFHGKNYAYWTEILSQGVERIKRRYLITYKIALGHNVSSLKDICFSYEFARYLLKNEFLFSGTNVLSPDFINENIAVSEQFDIPFLTTLIEIGDMEGLCEAVDNYKGFCISQLSNELEIKTKLISDIVIIKERILKKYKEKSELDHKMDEMISGILHAAGIDELMKSYIGILELMCQQVVQNNSGTVVKRVLHYMEKNYQENLRLDDISQLFHYNTSYLGTLFKLDTGLSFNHALEKIRMTQAAKMLTNSELKVYQIAEKVGYNNIDYFHIKFRNHMGISPKEYKKLNKQNTI